MRYLVLDTGVIISLASNGLLWLLGPMRKKFKGDFLMPASVRKEIIDLPLQSLRFKLEAMQVLSEVAKGNLKLNEEDMYDEYNRVFNMCNNIFRARGSYIQIMHPGEIGAIVLAKKVGAEALLIDERTTRVLIEGPLKLKELLQSKLHTKVDVNKENLAQFIAYTKGMKVLRSTEFCVIAFESGFLDEYALPGEEKYVQGELKAKLLEAVLWGLKMRGCSISDNEVYKYLELEGFRQIQ